MLLHPRRRLAPALLLAVLALLALPTTQVHAAPDPLPLTAQPSAVDFGLVGIDWGQNSTTVAVQNTGPDTVAISAASIDGPGSGAYWIGNDGCTGQLLGSGATCLVNVSFDPWEGISYDATLHVPSDAGELTVSLAGVGGVQQVSPTPSEADFGSVDVGEAATRSITLQNTGNLPYQAIVALPSGTGVGAFRVMQDTCSLRQLDPGDTCALVVRFAPTAPEEAVANLMVIGGNGAPALVALHGAGRQAAAVIAPASADFGIQVRDRAGAVQTLTVVNGGNGLLRIAAAAIGGLDAEQFRIVGENCTAAPLEPAATCVVRVRFTPTASGVAAATLRLVTNDAAGVATAALSGRGVSAAAASGLPASVAFGWRAGSPAPFALGRIDLGVVRCVRAARCHVSVRARVFLAQDRTSSVASRSAVWHPGRGARVLLSLPENLRGTPVLLVADLRIHAAGRPAGTRTIVVPLVPGWRRGSVIVTGVAARSH